MVAATFEEERCPALPARSTSRDLGLTDNPGTSTEQRSGSMKILLLAIVSGVVLVGGGVGIAFQHGFLSPVVGGTTPRPSTVTAGHGASRHAEFLKERASQEVPRASSSSSVLRVASPTVAPLRSEAVLERTHEKAHRMVFTNAARHHAEVTPQRNSTTIVNSSAHNDTASSQHNASSLDASTNGTVSSGHNGTQNKTVNITAGNITHANHTRHKRKHMKCKGGTLAACQCIFACQVFGAQPSQCSGEKAELMDSLVRQALTSPTHACRGMQCILRCAKSLQCYDDRLEQDCIALHNRSRDAGVEDDTCSYECDKDDSDAILT